MALSSDEESDVEFWNNQLDKVLKGLKEGLEQVVVQQEGKDRDWERPLERAKAFKLALKGEHDCPYCEESSSDFSILMLHVLETHVFYGRDLLSTLKNGQNVRRIR